MDVIAWSTNLTRRPPSRPGVAYVSKDELFSRADVLTIHLVLSERSRGLVGAAELGLMKPTALLVNTSRGPIVDESALVDALRSQRLAGAGLDVFDTEPLPAGHPLRSLDNAVATPHIGYVAEQVYRTFYGEAAGKIGRWRPAASAELTSTYGGGDHHPSKKAEYHRPRSRPQRPAEQDVDDEVLGGVHQHEGHRQRVSHQQRAPPSPDPLATGKSKSSRSTPACSEGIAATRFTLACPELTSAPADCRCSVPQPRVEIRSTNW